MANLRIRRLREALALGCAAVLVACGPGDNGACDVGGAPEACVPLGVDAGSASGRWTRVAPLGEDHLAVVTAAGVPGAVRVLIYGPRGEVRGDVALLPPVLTGGPPRRSPQVWPAIATIGDIIHVVWHDLAGGRLLHAEGRVDGEALVDVALGPLTLAFGPPSTVDGGPGAPAGSHAALAIAADGQLHLAYRHDTNRSLGYATRPAAAPGEAAPAWRREQIPACAGISECVKEAEDYGTFPALVLVPGGDGAAEPRIAFRDEARGDLRLAARGASGVWAVTTLDGTDPVTGADTGDVGAFASLAVTPARSLALVYHDATAGTLRALTPGDAPRVLDDGLWETADGRQLRRTVGQFARLAVTPDGVWHVVHLEADGPRWRYLTLAGERVTVSADLDGLPPGGWLDLTPRGDGLAGAYGAFKEAGSLMTALRWFEVRAR
jgi:hypothetical protein